MKRYIQCRQIKKATYMTVSFFSQNNSRILKSKFPLNEGVCRNIWQNKNFATPGFGDMTFKVNRLLTETILQQASGTTYVKEYSQSFMAKNGREGAMYAEPVEWVSPLGENLSEKWKSKQQ